MSDVDPVAAAPTEHLCNPMDGERANAAYRAFLLYGMCAPDKRSIRAVSRVVGISEAGVRKWCARWSWKARTSRDDADRVCVSHYWQLFHDKHGDQEVRQLVELMRVPYIEPGVNKPRVVFDAAPKAEKAVETLSSAESDKNGKRRDLLGKILDGMIYDLGLALKEKRIRYNAGDIEKLLRSIHMLQGLTADGGAVGAGGVSLDHLESVRVKLARATGDTGKLMQAALDDAQEQVLILTQLLKPAAEYDPDSAPSVSERASG